MTIPWGTILEVVLKLIDVWATSLSQKNAMKLKMYEFARRFDIDAVDKNSKHREEYRSLKEELAKKAEAENGGTK